MNRRVSTRSRPPAPRAAIFSFALTVGLLSAQADDAGLRAEAADDPIAAAVTEAMRAHDVPGVVVAVQVGDRVVVRRAFGHADVAERTPMTPDHLLHVGSVTKSMTAVLLGVLVDAGVVAFDDPVAEHLPEDVSLPEPLRAITLRQLASHTSGLPRNPVNRRDRPESPSVMEPYSITELHAGLATTELEHAPGERFGYSNLGFALLGHALETAAGVPFEQALRERVLEPLGMTDTGIEIADDETRQRFASGYWFGDDGERIAREAWRFGDVAAFAGAWSNVDDLLAFTRSQLADEDGRAVLEAATRDALHAGTTDVGAGRTYGMGFFRDELPGIGALLGHGGEVDSSSCCFAAAPKAQLAIVVLANQGDRSAEQVLMAVMQRALPKLLRRRG